MFRCFGFCADGVVCFGVSVFWAQLSVSVFLPAAGEKNSWVSNEIKQNAQKCALFLVFGVNRRAIGEAHQDRVWVESCVDGSSRVVCVWIESSRVCVD